MGRSVIRRGRLGWGFLAGLGYGVGLGQTISITPSFDYYYGSLGDVDTALRTIPGTRYDVLDFAIGVGFH